MANAERKIVISPGGTRIDISTMEPSIQLFVENVCQKATSEFSMTQYGRAAMALAVAAIGSNSNGDSPETQIEYFKRCALEKIKEFGPSIIPFLKEELQAAIIDEDLANLDK